jgi:hypothetical protein
METDLGSGSLDEKRGYMDMTDARTTMALVHSSF